MALLLSLACCLLTVPSAAPSTRINVLLDDSRPTQLYHAPGAWIITASAPRRPQPPPAGQPTRHTASVGADVGVAWTPSGDASALAATSNKRRPAAAVTEGDWTQHNSVEVDGAAAAAHLRVKPRPAASAANVRLPSFVVTSRPFGFSGSSNSGQGSRKPATQLTSVSGQGQQTSGQGQGRLPVKSYVRPNQYRPSSGYGFNRPHSDSFIFSSDPHSRPTAFGSQKPSEPFDTKFEDPTAVHNPSRPSAISSIPSSAPNGRRPSVGGVNSGVQTDQSSSALSSSLDDSSSQAAAEAGHPSPEPAPLAAPPAAGPTSVTRKTTPDTVSTVEGKKLRTYSLGCRQGRRCSFIIPAPTRLPQPTYTPYDRQTVDSYLQHFQSILALSNSKRDSASATSSASTSASSASESASASAASTPTSDMATKEEARPGTSAGAASVTYSTRTSTSVLSPGEAYREDIRRAASALRPVATSPPRDAVTTRMRPTSALMASGDRLSYRRPSQARVTQRYTSAPEQYRPGTAELYHTLRASPLTLRPAWPAMRTALTDRRRDDSSAGASEIRRGAPAGWSPVNYRQAKLVGGGEDPSGEDDGRQLETTGANRPAGQHWSRYTVEKVDPATKKTYPTPWGSAADGSFGALPGSGKIFKAHVSSGPITFQPRDEAKQARSDAIFKLRPVKRVPKTASIITADGVREFPNLLSSDSSHQASSSRLPRPGGRSPSQSREVVVRGVHHRAALLSQTRAAW